MCMCIMHECTHTFLCVHHVIQKRCASPAESASALQTPRKACKEKQQSAGWRCVVCTFDNCTFDNCEAAAKCGVCGARAPSAVRSVRSRDPSRPALSARPRPTLVTPRPNKAEHVRSTWWECAGCTFMNVPAHNRCAVCNALAPFTRKLATRQPTFATPTSKKAEHVPCAVTAPHFSHSDEGCMSDDAAEDAWDESSGKACDALAAKQGEHHAHTQACTCTFCMTTTSVSHVHLLSLSHSARGARA